MGLRPVRPSGVSITGPAAPDAVASSSVTSRVQERVVRIPVERSGRGPSGSGAVICVTGFATVLAAITAVVGARMRTNRRIPRRILFPVVVESVPGW